MLKKTTPKPKLTTVDHYKRWNTAKWSLYASMWALPLAPATAMTIINWDEWFAKSGLSLPFGFATLLASTLLSIIGIWKKDEIVNKTVSVVYYLALVFTGFGVSFLFLASLYQMIGYMMLATAGGLLASGTVDQINKSLVKPNVAFYKKLIEENCLDEKSKRKKQREEQARREAEEDAQRQATE